MKVQIEETEEVTKQENFDEHCGICQNLCSSLEEMLYMWSPLIETDPQGPWICLECSEYLDCFAL